MFYLTVTGDVMFSLDETKRVGISSFQTIGMYSGYRFWYRGKCRYGRDARI